MDVSAIRGGWEQFVVKTIDAPVKGVKKVLVIAGCDRRGTAYGVFTLSEAIGVSPLYWWLMCRRKESPNYMLSI